MNAANIEIGFYKTIGLMMITFTLQRYYLEKQQPMGLFWRCSGGWIKKSVAFACVFNNKTFKTEAVAINQSNVAQ